MPPIRAPEEERFVSAHSSRLQPITLGKSRQDISQVVIHTHGEEQRENECIHACQGPAHERVLLTFKEGLPTSVTPIQKIPHRPTQPRQTPPPHSRLFFILILVVSYCQLKVTIMVTERSLGEEGARGAHGVRSNFGRALLLLRPMLSSGCPESVDS